MNEGRYISQKMLSYAFCHSSFIAAGLESTRTEVLVYSVPWTGWLHQGANQSMPKRIHEIFILAHLSGQGLEQTKKELRETVSTVRQTL